jgi:hypothetical protein
MPRLEYYMGDLYPQMGNMSTRLESVPLPADQAAITQDDQDALVANYPVNVTSTQMNSHYFGLVIICAVILMLGVRL